MCRLQADFVREFSVFAGIISPQLRHNLYCLSKGADKMSKRKKRGGALPLETSMTAFSTSEQTGLIPADLGFDDALESYNEVYDYLPSENFVGREERKSDKSTEPDKKK